VVAVHVPAGPSLDTLLAMPTTCITVGPTHTDLGEDGLCGYATSQREGQPSRHTIDQLVDPTVRLKLELAGYLLADARTLRLETAKRIDEGTDGETRTGSARPRRLPPCHRRGLDRPERHPRLDPAGVLRR